MPVLALSVSASSLTAPADLTIRWLALSLDVSIKAVALALVAVVLLRLLRVRDVNIRHRVWAGVLAAMLLLPALTHVVPALRLPFTISPDWFATSVVEELPDLEPQSPAEPQPVAAEVAGDEVDPTLPAGTPAEFAGRPPLPIDPWGRARPGGLPMGPPSEFVGTDTSDVSSIAAVTPSAEQPVDALEASAKASASVPVSTQLLRVLPVLLCGAWLLGTALMTLRLFVGMWLAFRLQRNSMSIVPHEHPHSRPLSHQGSGQDQSLRERESTVAHRDIPIRECPSIRTPLTVGWARPQILLPPQWKEWSSDKLQAVLAHERTHAERGDCLLALLAEVNCCCYWFHPLSWWLRQHLASLAEAACDDAAVNSTGDRAQYARHLLEVAASVSARRGRVAAFGVSMARRSQVETRIHAILDFTRPLSRRLTWGTTLVLLGIIVPMIALAAALRPGDGNEETTVHDVAAAVEEDSATEASAALEVSSTTTPPLDPPVNGGKDDGRTAGTKSAAAKPVEVAAVDKDARPAAATETDDQAYRFAGGVIDPNGKPVEGAKIYLAFTPRESIQETCLPVAVSDDKGQFSFAPQEGELSDRARPRLSGTLLSRLMAVKEGYGFASGMAAYFETSGQLADELAKLPPQARALWEPRGQKTNVLPLVADDVPVRGRILDVEGRPVPGALIEVIQILGGADGSLDAWEAASKESQTRSSDTVREHLRFIASGGSSDPADSAVIPSVSTDDNGRFTLRGIGRERIVEFVVSKPGIESRQFYARTRPGETVTLLRNQRNPIFGKDSFYPDQFALAIGPSVPVQGRIIDSRSQQPIAGAKLQAQQVASDMAIGSAPARKIRAVTDNEGKYRLDGFPMGKNSFVVIPPTGSAWLAGGAEVETSAGSPPVELDVALTRGVMVRGRITDESTGQPVRGQVHYFAYQSNPHLKASSFSRAGLQPFSQQHYVFRSDADGNYAIPVLPGAGILGISVGADFPSGMGAGEIDCPRYTGQRRMFMTSPICDVDRMNLVARIDPQADAEEITVDFPLRSGGTIKGRVLSPEGEPLTDYFIFGDDARRPIWNAHQGAEFTVKAYFPAEGRRLMFFHPERNLVGVTHFSGESPRQLDVKLVPGGTVTGRIIDSAGDPIEKATFHTDIGRDALSAMNPNGPLKDQGIVVDRRLGSMSNDIETDAQGRFELKGFIPGLKYSATVSATRKVENFNGSMVLGTVFEDVTVQSGETKQLGDLTPKRRTARPRPDAKDAKSTPGDLKSATGGAAKEIETGIGTKKSTTATPPLDPPVNGGKDDGVTGAKSDGRNESNTDSDATLKFAGTVVDLDGKPVAGAEIWFAAAPIDYRDPLAKGMVRRMATSDLRGKFSFDLEPAHGSGLDPLSWMFGMARVLAKHPGYGFDWLPLAVFEENPAPSRKRDELRERTDKHLGVGRFVGRTLKLPSAAPVVQGRLVDLEGNPLADVSVAIENIRKADFAELNKLFEESSRDKFDQFMHSQDAPGGWITRHEWQILAPPVTTNKNGEFTFAGLGRDQMATVTFARERVAAEQLFIVGRDMEAKQLPHISAYPNGARDVFVGIRFSHVIGPAVPVSGTVTEFRSGKPVANARVFVERLFSENGNNRTHQLRLNTQHISAVTDAEGRFRLVGVPPGEGHVLNVIPPKSQPSLMATQEFSVESSQAGATVNVQVFRGIWIEGRVTDSATGEPISGHVDYLALQKNPHIPQKFGLRDTWEMERFPIDKEGRYRVAGLPGPGVLLVRSFGKTVYPRSVGAEKVDGYEAGNGFLPTTPSGMPLTNWHRIQQIDPPADAQSFTYDLTLSTGESLNGRVVMPNGAPATGVEALGLVEKVAFFGELADHNFTINNYVPGVPRELFFKAGGNLLVGYLRVEGAAPADLTARLQPAVTVRGRLIETETDEEAGGYRLYCESSKRGSFRIDDTITDKNGRFEIKGLLAGNIYKMDAANVRRFSNQKNGFTIDLTNAKPGEVLELGDVTGKNAKPKARAKDSAARRAQARGEQVIRGRVVDDQGTAVAGADVAVIGTRVRAAEGGDDSPRRETLAEAVSASDGRFELRLVGVSAKTHSVDFVVARSMTSGLAWVRLKPNASDIDATLTLRPEQIIRGRLVDIEGQPVRNLPIAVTGVWPTTDGGWPRDGVGFDDAQKLPRVWPMPVTSDDEGRFAIRGIATRHGVYLEIEGTDRIARQDVYLNTGMSEERGPRDGTYRNLVRNFPPGVEGVLPLAPAQIFSGVIRYEDTGEPAPHARLVVSATQQREGGSWWGVDAQADERGRYRVNPRPGIRFEIMAYPPSGAPYLIRVVREIVRKESKGVHVVDIALPRGVLVRGRVLDEGTGGPVAKAAIQYVPRDAAQQRAGEDIVTGWQGIRRSRDDGTFEIVVLPGAGTLVAHGPQGRYVVQETTSRAVQRGVSGGRRYYAHAFLPVDAPDAAGDASRLNSAPIEVSLKLVPGTTVAGRIVNERGEPVERATLVGRQQINPHYLEWRVVPEELYDGRFEISGLAEGVKSPVHFLDATNRLGATALISAADKNPTVRLVPCGQAVAKLVSKKGEPVTESSRVPSIEFVVTPASNRLAMAMGLGTNADADFASNIERRGPDPDAIPDREGRVTYSPLIPGLRYRIRNFGENGVEFFKEFVAESGKSEDLGQIVLPTDE